MITHLLFFMPRDIFLKIYDNEILSNITNFKKILIINEDLKSLLTDKDHQCYDEIYYTPAHKNNVGLLCFEKNTLLNILTEITKNVPPDKISICPIDEYNLETISSLSEHVGINTYPTDKAHLFRDKVEMKNYLKEHTTLPLPQHFLLDSTHDYNTLKKELNTPFIIKPVAEGSSYGICFIHGESDWTNWLKQHKNQLHDYEAETLLQGHLFHIDSVRHQGKIIAQVVCECMHPLGETLSGKAAGSILIMENHPAYKALVETNQAVLDAFNVDGCFHHECFWHPKLSAQFLEIAWREPGQPASFNFHQVYNTLSQSLFYTLAIAQQPLPEKNLSAYKRASFILVKRKGIYQGLHFPKLKSEFSVDETLNRGEEVLTVPESFHAPCATFSITNSDYSALYEDFLKLRNCDPYKS